MTRSRARTGARPTAFGAALFLIVGFVLSTCGTGPASSAPSEDADTQYASLSLTEVTPSTVTGSTGNTVTVRGRVTNTFDRPIRDVIVRLQRSTAVSSPDVRTVLDADASVYDTAAPFTDVAKELRPHQSADFTVSAPLSNDGLRIDKAGVYPLLVNVNGTPDYGGQARIADSRTLLPVLSLPADKARAEQWTEPGSGSDADPLLGRDGSVAADDSLPAAFTFVWPLASPPQQAAGTLGGDTADMRLTSDAMAESLEPTGRLGQSLQALETVAGVTDGDPKNTSPDARVRSAICIAVDPDLLVTVQGMASGYVVSDNPSDPAASTRDGTGAAAAKSWLQRLTHVASSMCVTALPYAQAGLDSLHRIGNADLTDAAISGAYDTVDDILGVKTVRGLTLPAVGTLSDDARDLLTGLDGSGGAAVVSTSVDVGDRPRTGSSAVGRYVSGRIPLQTYDAGVSAALGAVGPNVTTPSFIPAWQRVDTSGESEVSRRQTAAASLALPMLDLPEPTTDPAARVTAVTGRSAFTMPPTYWSPTPADARSLLDTAGLLVASGAATAVPLTDVVTDLPNAHSRADLIAPGDVSEITSRGHPVAAKDLTDIQREVRLIDRLEDSFVNDHELPFSPTDYLDPLRLDILRAVSTPSSPDLRISRVERPQRLTAVDATLTRVQQSVSLLDPSGRYTLASERSPLLLVVRNDLALPIKVRLDITAPDEISVGDMGVVEIPAQGTRQLQLPTHASSSQPATVRIALVTSNDVPLSSPVDLSIYANAYGKPLFYITIAAGVILILLTARRLWHRFRGEPDPADEDRPEPDEHERELASAGYQQRRAAERVVADGAEREDPDPGERA